MPDSSQIDYDGLIPNNVGLADDLRVRKALETWHPGYIDWWKTMGPEGFQNSPVFLRTAVGVGSENWAKFDFVRMPEYRWGMLLAPEVEGRTIPFGAHKGEPAWQEVPGEYRAMLRRLLVIQGDTEPASVEQQRHLGATAPSLYDLRNLFQVNVEEGRHLWAMVYLLQKYFGRDGREEAEELLRRRSGDTRFPPHAGRVQRTDAGLAVVLHVHLLHRPRRQDAARRAGAVRLRSAVAHLPLHADRGSAPHVRRRNRRHARHPAHRRGDEGGRHRRSVRHRADARLGVIDLPTIQKKANLHFSLTLDLFGNEISTNAANAFNAGLKGRYQEDRLTDDHQLTSSTYPVLRPRDGAIVNEDVPALSALNMRLRDDYVADAAAGVARWNRVLERTGIDFRITLPHVAFNRRIGEFSAIHADTEGKILSSEDWHARRKRCCPLPRTMCSSAA